MQPTHYPTNQLSNQPTSQPSILPHPRLPHYINRAAAARPVDYAGQQGGLAAKRRLSGSTRPRR
ncbi:MAG: PT domain-containing protein [Anaerolineales bacterium]|nr:PT domain-containing protein [Anaerolineales bacterium]